MVPETDSVTRSLPDGAMARPVANPWLVGSMIYEKKRSPDALFTASMMPDEPSLLTKPALQRRDRKNSGAEATKEKDI